MKTVFILALICGLFAQSEEQKQSYEVSRNLFLKAKPSSWTSIQWNLETESDLSTDIIYSKNKKSKAVIISSGLHGIEGFVGSWIQQKVLQTDWLVSCSADLFFIHSLNPWGMKYHRRTNQFNIDLNRNFSTKPDLYKTANEDYKKINDFLNPTTAYSSGLLEKPFFIGRSLWLIVNHSIETLRRSILKGQYHEPKGLYYGGAEASALQYAVTDFTKEHLKDYKQSLWIDLHTGYGAKNKLHLLANSRDEKKKQQLQSLFKDQSIDFGDSKNFYDTTGDLISYVDSLSTLDSSFNGIVFEYGTLDSQKTLGSIESLRRMIRENQTFQNKAADEESRLKSQSDFDMMFAPTDPEFYEQIWAQTEPLLKDLCTEK